MMQDSLHIETDAAFAERIAPDLKAIEELRVFLRKRFLLRVKIVAGIMALAACGVAYAYHIDPFYIRQGIWLVPLLFIAASWAVRPFYDYAKNYKTALIPKLAALFGFSTYKANGALPLDDLQASKILPIFTNYESEDYFEGIYKGARVRFAEITMTQEQGTGKNRTIITTFQGLAILVNLPRRKFFGHTIITRAKAGMFEWVESKSLGLKRADLVDPVFEKKYSVFTTDQTEARYLIDPAMIERVNSLDTVYKARSMSMAYYNNDQVLAMLGLRLGHNLFEPPSMFSRAADLQSLLAIRHEIAQILRFIDYLDIYQPVTERTTP
jgi:Protein of unknown function (DUF3137)